MRILVSILCTLLTSLALAQTPEGMNRIESARIALITERLELTPEQAEKFWPLYREYMERREDLRKELLSAKSEIRKDEEMTDEESKKLVDKALKLKERKVALDRDYSDKFNRVITARQLIALRNAEDDFRQMLLERLEKRRDMRDRLERREDRKNNE
jgi:hypothetical protein